MSVGKVLKKLLDRPVEKREDLIDREEELLTLTKVCEYYEGGIIGVAGERGIGKTSLLNVFRVPGKEKVIINIVDRENKMAILSDILHGLHEYFKSRGKLNAEVLKQLAAEAFSLSLQLGNVGVEKKEKENVRNIVKKLREILKETKELVIILDEIDKEEKEEILLIIDSIKEAFKYNEVTLIVALPYSIYEEFLSESEKETFNLNNVFDYIIAIPPMTDQDLELLIEKKAPGILTEKAKILVLKFARGNPRRLIRTIKEAGLLAFNEERITEFHIKAVLRKYLSFFAKQHLRDKDLAILKLLPTEVEKIAKRMRLSKPSVYKILHRLEDLGLVKDKKPTQLGELVAEVL